MRNTAFERNKMRPQAAGNCVFKPIGQRSTLVRGRALGGRTFSPELGPSSHPAATQDGQDPKRGKQGCGGFRDCRTSVD